jgi:two-component system CheB/CheR fusion protein
VQKKLIPLFHYSLTPGGVLILGSAETIGNFTDLFTPLNNKLRIFQRKESALPLGPIEFPASFASPLPIGIDLRAEPKPPLSLQSLADQLILEHYAPPTVLVNEKGDILYVSGRTGKYLEPASGKANWNVFAMAREGLRYELGKAFQEALQKETPVTVCGLKIETNAGWQHLDVTVQRLMQPESLRGLVMILFTDVAPPLETKISNRPGRGGRPPAHNIQLEELERKFQQARIEAQTVREEMQTSQEELRSTNEEMQSTNEELQSTNEELTTSKEEMQSLNEELQTVNTELQSKVDELSRSNNDMKNLLNSTDIATLFLDGDLKVRRFTTQATKIIKLIAGDVGRPITDLASDLLYPELTTDAQEVLRKLGFVEKPVNARDGRWFTVRIMPYRTLDDRIDGVVITFADITAAKTLEAQLREKHDLLARHLAQQSKKTEKTAGKTRGNTARLKRGANAPDNLPATGIV